MKTLDKISNFLKKPLIKYGLPVVAGLTILSGCENDNQKYQDFATFVIENDSNYHSKGHFDVNISKDGEKYVCYADIKPLGGIDNFISINIYSGKSFESFIDRDFNGLDFYSFEFHGKNKQEDYWFQSKENKEVFDSLIINIPKWYKESKEKKAQRKISQLEKYTLKNKKIYSDFKKFLNNNYTDYGTYGNGIKDKSRKWYRGNLNGKELGIRIKGSYSRLMLNFMFNSAESFSDYSTNGLDSNDSYGTDKEKETNLKRFSEGKQLQIAKEYTHYLKQIMHKANVEGY